MTTLDRRALNRATLARQFLLERGDDTALAVVRRLVGLQAQDPEPPCFGLWSRIEGFRAGDLAGLLHSRDLVRATLLRGTQHLVAADDYLWLRPVLQPMLLRWQRGAFGKATAGLDTGELADAARGLLTAGPVPRPELGRALADRWPGRDPVGLARSVQGLLPVLHPPPDGTWGRRGTTPFALAEQWLGRPLADDPSLDDLVLRYLAAFGPASVRDVQAWSGATRLGAVVDRLRPRLCVFRGEDGRELFDLPDAPRPDPATPAPVRFLALLDNVLVGHHDRSRIVEDDRRPYLVVEAPLTVDGFVRGLWRLERPRGRSRAEGGGRDRAVLDVRLFTPLTPAEEDAVAEEGERLLGLAAADADGHGLRLRPLDP
ncbi:winged helix DNA-binding domain-containing protein [Nocardiopsis sp. CA-288880]|uniref:winged helix DNA-binding domain-containing protein n=1 Tax=Nocardiopsis sp. CA-288880 TaxID=3239995 RepID=UPI003D991F95